MSLGSNIFQLSKSKTVYVRGIHVRHCMGSCNVLGMVATGGETRLHAMHGVRHWRVKHICQVSFINSHISNSDGFKIRNLFRMSNIFNFNCSWNIYTCTAVLYCHENRNRDRKAYQWTVKRFLHRLYKQWNTGWNILTSQKSLSMIEVLHNVKTFWHLFYCLYVPIIYNFFAVHW